MFFYTKTSLALFSFVFASSKNLIYQKNVSDSLYFFFIIATTFLPPPTLPRFMISGIFLKHLKMKKTCIRNLNVMEFKQKKSKEIESKKNILRQKNALA